MSENPTGLTHFDASGRAVMVDVSGKAVTARKAIATGQVVCDPATLALVKSGSAEKGDVIGVSELAGIMGAKQTASLIPLCHPLPLSKVTVAISVNDGLPGFDITAQTKTEGQTGVEMEALTAVSVACLTLYDMLKAADKHMVIGQIKLIEKTGGKSGHFTLKGNSK